MDRRPDAGTLAALAGFVVLAGANGTAVAFSNRELAPFWGGALRFLMAAWLFLVVALVGRRPFPAGRALLGAALYGAFAFGGTFGFIYWAFQFVKPGAAQVILALAPLVTLVLAVAQGLERFRWNALVGALASLAGIGFIFQGQLAGGLPMRPLLALLGAALCIAQATIITKKFPRSDPVATNGVAMAVSAFMLLAASLATGEKISLPTRAETWAAVAFLVLAGSVVAFALYLVVLRRWTATAASYQWVLLPLVAVPLSAGLTGEHISSTLIVGGLLVLAGVYVGALWQPKGARETRPDGHQHDQ